MFCKTLFVIILGGVSGVLASACYRVCGNDNGSLCCVRRCFCSSFSSCGDGFVYSLTTFTLTCNLKVLFSSVIKLVCLQFIKACCSYACWSCGAATTFLFISYFHPPMCSMRLYRNIFGYTM